MMVLLSISFPDIISIITETLATLSRSVPGP